ncbi:MAG: nucleoside deaminase [Actinomycetota bacterium]
MNATSRDLDYLTRAVQLAADARERGDHPFGALFVTIDGRVVEAMNSVNTAHDPTGHAETNLVRLAYDAFDAAQLAGGTLYTSTEPCAMCAGAIYWAGIGRVAFALSGHALVDMVAVGSPALDLPSREVFSHGFGVVVVEGPFDVPGAIEVHDGMWE